MRAALGLIFLFAAVACGTSEPEPAPPVVVSGDQYDCRAVALPEKRDTARPDCVFDATCDAKIVVGHRGMGGGFALYAPENSVSAIQLAIVLGVDAVEIDVRHTSDDQLVVLHDGTLRRTTGVERDVTSLTLAEAVATPLLAEGYIGDFGCLTIPSFADVLELARDRVFLVVDTKTNRADLVAQAIEGAGMLEQAVISVSNVEKAVAARDAVPAVGVQLRPNDVPAYEAMLAMLDRPPEVIEIPERELESFVPIAANVEAKLFLNVFDRDFVAFGDGNVGQYNEPFTAGADIAQSEFPMWVLRAQGRRFWDSLETPRDLGISSPLLD